MNKESHIKIAFVGTSCIGKTTLVEHYRKKFENNPKVAIVPEAAREYFIAHPEIPPEERFGLVPQGEIQQLAIQKEHAAVTTGAEMIICDRSVLDAVAYVRGHGDIEGSRELLSRVESCFPPILRSFY